MWKLTNLNVKVADLDDKSCYWILLEVTRKHARAYARSIADISTFVPGTRVCITDLKAKPELNGVEGTLVAFNADKARWQVQLDNDLGSKLFKEENLEPYSTLAML